MAPVQPFTPPADWTDHGFPGLICRPAGWTSIASFFISNFVTHAFTVKRSPAQTTFESALVAFVTLCYPSFGIVRALQALIFSAKLPDILYEEWMPRKSGRNSLQRAQAAGALCMVVRSDSWRPASGDMIRNAPDPKAVSIHSPISTARSTSPTLENISARPQADQATVIELQPIRHSQSDMDSDMDKREPSPDSVISGQLKATCRVVSPPWLNKTPVWTSRINTIVARSPAIHGAYQLPNGYEFAIVPSDAEIALPVPSPRDMPTVNGAPRDDRNISTGQAKLVIATSSNWLTVVVALYQIIYGGVVLFQARGDQINLFGYSAFGLTVVPYVIMTIVNLLVQIFTDDYPALYMVHTAEMEEATSRHAGVFEGVVGTIELGEDLELPENDDIKLEEASNGWTLRAANDGPESWLGRLGSVVDSTEPSGEVSCTFDTETTRWPSPDLRLLVPCCSVYRRKERNPVAFSYLHSKLASLASLRAYITGNHEVADLVLVYVTTIFIGIVLAIVGGLSGFEAGTISTSVQRGLTMTWIIWGGLTGPAVEPFVRSIAWGEIPMLFGDMEEDDADWRIKAFVLLLYSFPAIGGMAIAGLELKQFGSCLRVPTS